MYIVNYEDSEIQELQILSILWQTIAAIIYHGIYGSEGYINNIILKMLLHKK